MRCGARRKNGGFCRRHALKGHWRCKIHGGAAKKYAAMQVHRKPSPEVIAAMHAGYQRWLYNMRDLKIRGLIRKIRPRKRLPTDMPQIRRTRGPETAMAIILHAKSSLPERSTSPFTEQTPAEKLNTNVHLALEKMYETLSMPCEPDNLKLRKIQSDLSYQICSLQVRVDEAFLKERRLDKLPEILREMNEAMAKAREQNEAAAQVEGQEG